MADKRFIKLKRIIFRPSNSTRNTIVREGIIVGVTKCTTCRGAGFLVLPDATTAADKWKTSCKKCMNGIVSVSIKLDIINKMCDECYGDCYSGMYVENEEMHPYYQVDICANCAGTGFNPPIILETGHEDTEVLHVSPSSIYFPEDTEIRHIVSSTIYDNQLDPI